jgi:hypothetical protein
MSQQSTDLTIYDGEPTPLARAARVADSIAQAQTLADYRTGKAENTLARQRDDIALFESYLAEAGVGIEGMADDLRPWADVSHGLVSGFVRWQLGKGYSVGSVNVRLSTVRTYARLAAKAGYLATTAYQEITLIRTISGREGRNIDEGREVTRVGHKKAEPVAISPSHVALIKSRLRELATAWPCGTGCSSVCWPIMASGVARLRDCRAPASTSRRACSSSTGARFTNGSSTVSPLPRWPPRRPTSRPFPCRRISSWARSRGPDLLLVLSTGVWASWAGWPDSKG